MIPSSTVYFCGYCEDEVVGQPAGARLPDQRPLCSRCTGIGLKEGWAMAEAAPYGERIYQAGFRPSALLLVLAIVMMAAVTAAAMLLLGNRQK